MLEGDHRQRIVELARAEGDVVTHAPAPTHNLLRPRNPASAEPRQAKRLGERPGADGAWSAIPHRPRQRRHAREFQPAVGLVAQDPGIKRFGKGVDFIQLLIAQHRPGRVMGGVDDNQLRARGSQRAQVIEIVVERSLRAEVPESDIAADRARDTVQLLIGGRHGHHTVAGIEQLVEQQVVGLDGARGDEDLVRAGVRIGCRDETAQFLAAACLAVPKPGVQQRLQRRVSLLRWHQIHDLTHRHWVDAAFGDVPLDYHLVLRHPAFKLEGLDPHVRSSSTAVVIARHRTRWLLTRLLPVPTIAESHT